MNRNQNRVELKARLLILKILFLRNIQLLSYIFWIYPTTIRGYCNAFIKEHLELCSNEEKASHQQSASIFFC